MSWQAAVEPRCEELAEDTSGVETVIVPRARDLGGFEVRRALPSASRQMVGPFIFFDQMGPAEFLLGQGIDVRPHPHIGLATVTYLIDGEIIHRDSLGTLQAIRPGEVNWMTAGRGIAHSERTAPEARKGGARLFGIQTWVALPKHAEETAPAFAHHEIGELPMVEDHGGTVRLVLGSLYGRTSPVRTFTEMFYADATLAEGARLPLDPSHEERAVYIVDGTIEIAGDRFEKAQLLVFRPGDRITIAALTPARLILLGGEPMDGPRHIWWNFVSRPRPTGRPGASPRSRARPSSSRCRSDGLRGSGVRGGALHLGLRPAVARRHARTGRPGDPDSCRALVARSRGSRTGRSGAIQPGSATSEDSVMVDPQPRPRALNVALAGAGMISWHHLVAWRSVAPAARVIAVCDPNPERARSRAAEFGIDAVFTDGAAMLDQVEVAALDVAAPRAEHAGWVEAAAARGIDVLCQKPLTPTLAEAEALLGRLRGSTRLMVHENWRFRPWYRALGRWIADGELGEILHAQITMMSSGLLPDESGRRPALERQPFMAGERRLMIAEVLIHHLDVMRFLCGPLRVVSARASRTLPEVRGESLAAMFLETAAGAPVLVSGTMAAPGLGPRTGDRLELVGSKASAAFAEGTLHLKGPRPRSQSFDLDAGYQASFDGTIRHFVECLASGAAFETDAVDNLETLRLVEHAYWAAGLHACARNE